MIRKASLEDAPFIATISVKAWQESYQGIIDQSVLDALSVKERLENRLKFFTKSASNISKGQFIAYLDETIIGFCDTGPSRADLAKGEIYAIYVLNAYKGMGVGYYLFSTAVSFLHDKGLCPYIAWALAENKPARAFYERQGGKICKVGEYTIAGKTYPEVCYRFEQTAF